jgi:hypothetical protein
MTLQEKIALGNKLRFDLMKLRAQIIDEIDEDQKKQLYDDVISKYPVLEFYMKPPQGVNLYVYLSKHYPSKSLIKDYILKHSDITEQDFYDAMVRRHLFYV